MKAKRKKLSVIKRINRRFCVPEEDVYKRQTIESSEDFAQLFLEKGLVATVPCTAFAAPGFVRWSYATSLAEIDKGLDRLEAFIKNA